MSKVKSIISTVILVFCMVFITPASNSQENQTLQDKIISEDSSTPSYESEQEINQNQELQTRPFRLLKRNKIHLQALDKITARISDLYVNVGQQIRFQAIVINVNVCYENPPEEKPESIAHIVIHEDTPSAKNTLIFQGWMYSSSPAINGVEHPVYDVWVNSCIAE